MIVPFVVSNLLTKIGHGVTKHKAFRYDISFCCIELVYENTAWGLKAV